MPDTRCLAPPHSLIHTLAWLVFSVFCLALQHTAAAASTKTDPSPPDFPVSLTSCGRSVTYTQAPERALAYGSNLTETMLALGLEDRMLGFASVRPSAQVYLHEHYPASRRFAVASPSPLPLELMVDKGVDFFFSGWHYGLRTGTEYTPARLAQLGIPVYELTESCANIKQGSAASFDYLFRDINHLGAIFGVRERAGQLIENYQRRLDHIGQKVAHAPRPSVFVDGAGDRSLMSAGGLSMPQAIIDAAGGQNVLEHMPASWVQLGWEAVIDANPQVIIVLTAAIGKGAAERIAYLQSHPLLADVDAVRHQRYVVLDYDQLVPGPQNVDAVEQLAKALHPTSFEPRQLDSAQDGAP